jgi:hypothetical protein
MPSTSEPRARPATFHGSQGGFGLRQRGKSAAGNSTEPALRHPEPTHRLQGNWARYGAGYPQPTARASQGAMSSSSDVGSPTTFQ